MHRSGARAARRALIASLALALPAPARALDPSRAVTQYQVEAWGREQGLPQQSASALAQTPDGYLWIGTEEGLARFDGVRFTVFDTRNSGLRSKAVAALLEDGAGTLWIGTKGGGLHRLAGGRIEPVPGLPHDHVWALALAADGAVWAGTQGGGAARIVAGRVERVVGLANPNVWALWAEPSGVVWMGSDGGLARWDGRTVHAGVVPVPSAVTALRGDGAGGLWIGTRGGALLHLLDGAVREEALPAPSSEVTALRRDAAGSLWVGTKGNGLLRLGAGGLQVLDHDRGLPDHGVMALLEDAEGSLWAGTHGGGLARLRDSRFVPFSRREGLSSDRALSVLAARDGAVWVGTEQGLNRIRAGRVDLVLGRADGLRNDTVLSLLEAKDGALWIGTAAAGAYRLTEGRLTQVARAQGLEDTLVRVLMEDRAGDVWAGTNHGLFRGRGSRFEPAGLPAAVVTTLFEDADGSIWAGTFGDGLHQLPGGRHFGVREGLGSDNVRKLFRTAGGLWVATEGGGLARLDQDRVRVVGTAQGLFDDTAFDVVADGQGWLWMNSHRGVFRVQEADLDAVAEGRQAALVSLAYGTADGMRSPEALGGPKPAAARDRDGRLWFPTLRGVVAVLPGADRLNERRPPVAIEALRVDGQAYAAGPGLVVPPGGESLEIDYTALSLRVPARVRFRYRLHGFDRGWVDPGARRVAYYTQVPPGRYRFHVLAANDDGLWNEEGASLSFELLPRWYQRRSVRAAGLLALLGLAWAAHRGRLRRLQRRERELTLLVEDRTRELRTQVERTQAALQEVDLSRQEAERQRGRAESANAAKSTFLASMSHELRTPLNALLGFVQVMQRESRPARDHERLSIVARSGEHLLGLINDVLSLSRIEAGREEVVQAPFDLRGLCHGLEDLFQARARAQGLRLEVRAGAALPPYVSGDERRLRQVLLNLIGNALKFTREGGVAVRADWCAGRACFEVEDSGPGIDAGELTRLFDAFVQAEAGRQSGQGAGLGLAISRNMVRLMGGELSVSSTVGRGSLFRVEVPLPACAPPLAAGPAPPSALTLAPGQPAPRVLVVDDVPENRQVLAALLAPRGFEVEEAADGAEALVLCERQRFDAVLLDVRMRGLDGLATARALREAEAAARPPLPRRALVAVSASAFEHEREAMLQAGCDAFLAKPVRDEELMATLSGLLPSHFAGGPVAPGLQPARLDQLRGHLLSQPEEWRERLGRAVAELDVEKARAVAREMEEVDAEAAQSLVLLVDQYRFESIEGLLDAR